MMLVHTEPEAGLQIDGGRNFALKQNFARLAAGPALVAAFWNQIGEPANLSSPDLTVFYCAVRSFGKTFAFLEFVAGETLEQLIKRSDPAASEWQIPLFCRLLDAFEGTVKTGDSTRVKDGDLELIDFGIGRASAAITSRLHGSVMVSPGGDWQEQVYGEYGGSRSQVFAAMMELCARLPGGLPRSSAYGAANLGECAVCSLTTAILPSKLSTPIPAPRVKSRLLSRTVVSPYIIAIATAGLV